METQKYTWGIGVGEGDLRLEYYSPYYEKEKHENTTPFIYRDERITTAKTLSERLKKNIDEQFES